VIDFAGKVGGKPFEGGSGEDMSVELGSGQLIPGFEDGLAGAKAGDKREVAVTFPADYPSDQVKGEAGDLRRDGQGGQDRDQKQGRRGFRQVARAAEPGPAARPHRDQQQQELNDLTRTHMKRQLLDQLAARHDFPVPQSMVEAEFQNIMNQLRHEASHEEDQAAALAEIEKDAPEYRHIAERRVRLGLLLSEIGAANGVAVSDQEMNRLIGQAASQYQGKDREPSSATSSRSRWRRPAARPLYEDKVVDFLFSKAESATARRPGRARGRSRERRGPCPRPGCGHDHAARSPKEAAKKGKAETKAQPEEPAKGPVEKASDKPKRPSR
jgi:trigger factor